MARIVVSTELDATPAEVWIDVQDLASHVEWMADAEEIRFTTPQRTGEGTTFECDTKVGPLRLTDLMSITAWEPPEGQDHATMGVRHDGLVTGVGEFRIEPLGDDRSRFTWDEDLTFPWWMGGAVGGRAGKPVLRAIWKRNLKRLQQRFA